MIENSELINHKVNLYRLLLDKSIKNNLESNEINILYFLSKDSDIQNYIQTHIDTSDINK